MGPKYLEQLADLAQCPSGHWVIDDIDGDGAYYYVGPEPSYQAAQDFVRYWGLHLQERDHTEYYTVLLGRVVHGGGGTSLGEHVEYTVRLDPPEPPCDGRDAHEWEETSARGKGPGEGPGVVVCYTCSRCGSEKVVDTAGDLRDGTVGEVIEYVAPGRRLIS